MKIVYIKYADPKPFNEDPAEKLPTHFHRIIFNVAGILIREDEDLLFIGERAVEEDNRKVADRYGKDMFPAYRNVLPVRKSDIIERKDIEV